MKNLLHRLKQLLKGPLSPLSSCLWNGLVCLERGFWNLKWAICGPKKPTPQEQQLVRENVTFFYKSFQRQHLAKRLCRNLQSYYPGVRVIIADDSEQPLELAGENLTVIQLPFNSGLSRGLNQALARVQTPFAVRLDDDELLCPHSHFHRHLQFLLDHPEADLVAVLPRNLPFGRGWKTDARKYYAESMAHAPIPLRLPHLYRFDKTHVVLGKVPNIFIARTEALRAVGYDDNIRMIDHQDFFFRAAGRLVSVLAEDSYVLHDHNPFHREYQKFRADVQGDRAYIWMKYNRPMPISRKDNSQ